MSKSTGLAIIETTTYFENTRPDVVIVIADRFENLSVAIAASYLNIPLIHIQGGEVTGSIDEKVRHAITKLSDIHFVSNSRAKKFLINMVKNKEKIFITGCPSIDLVKGNTKSLDKTFLLEIWESAIHQILTKNIWFSFNIQKQLNLTLSKLK